MGEEARATKDLDAAVRARAEQIESLPRDALARGWDGFSFRLVSWEPIHDTAAWRGDIKLQFKGQPFSTVQFEAAPAEGDAGRGTQLVDNTFVDVAALGLSPVGELPLVTLAYMLAQKLHACTDHSLPNRENDRARDLIDILLVRRLLADDELPGVRRACVEIFRLRNKHPWPRRRHRRPTELGQLPDDRSCTDLRPRVLRQPRANREHPLADILRGAIRDAPRCPGTPGSPPRILRVIPARPLRHPLPATPQIHSDRVRRLARQPPPRCLTTQRRLRIRHKHLHARSTRARERPTPAPM